MTAARTAAAKAIEDAIDALMAVLRDENDDYNDVLAIDAVLLVGIQWYDDDGDRCGNITVSPRHGSQPYYTTIGLLDAARQQIYTTADD